MGSALTVTPTAAKRKAAPTVRTKRPHPASAGWNERLAAKAGEGLMLRPHPARPDGEGGCAASAGEWLQ